MIKAVIFDMYETLITHYNCPLYFGAQIAADAGVPIGRFRLHWDPTESDRSVGKLSFEAVITDILTKEHRYSEERLQTICQKRLDTKRACFDHLHPEILPMLDTLKEKGIKIGLISNCFSEEVIAIRESVLFPYFDAPMLSYEQKMQKPTEEIFHRCTDALGVAAADCLYIGDGGSFELETAKKLGMQTAQAAWYLDGFGGARKTNVVVLERPLAVFDHII